MEWSDAHRGHQRRTGAHAGCVCPAAVKQSLLDCPVERAKSKANEPDGADRAAARTTKPGDAVGTGAIAGVAATAAGSNAGRVAATVARAVARLGERPAAVGGAAAG